MRKFFTIFIMVITLVLITSFIGSLYIPETYNRKSLSLGDRISCILQPTKIQNQSIKQYAAKRKSAVKQEQTENNLKLLDGDAHQFALKNYCQQSGHQLIVDEDNGLISCEFTPESCVNSNDLRIKTSENGTRIYDLSTKYREWHNGKCIKTMPAAKSLCDLKYNFSYDKGDVVCDSENFGKCTAKRKPTCYIPEEYCKSMGLEYDSANGFGDCYNPLWQELLEAIVGTTIVRKIKEAINRIASECKQDPFGSGCAKAVSLTPLILPTIVKDTTFKFFPERWNELTDKCGSITSGEGSSESIVNCMLAFWKFDPVSYLAITLVKVLGVLVCDMLADKDTTEITDQFCDLGRQVIKGLLLVGDKAIEYLLKFPEFGKIIVENITQLAELIGKEFEGLKDKMLDMFDGINDFLLDIPNFIDNIGPILEFHPVFSAAKALLYGSIDVVNHFIELFDERKIVEIIEYASVITNAFEKGGQELGEFVTETVISDGLEAITLGGELLGSAFGQSAIIFIDGAKEIGNVFENQIGGNLKEAGETVGEFAEDAAGAVGEFFVDGGEAIGGAFVDGYEFFTGGCCIC